MQCTPEEVGYWYFRLNGFLTIANFIIHPDETGNQLTDIDILGVRFPYRAELLRDPMPDDDKFLINDHKPYIIIGEIKAGRCQINHPLRNSDNIHRILRAIGMFSLEEAPQIAQTISQQGNYDSDEAFVTLCCIGDHENPYLTETHPKPLQFTWSKVLSFIFKRFERYRGRKGNHDQWDRVGKLLWNSAAKIRDEDEFIQFIKTLWRVQ